MEVSLSQNSTYWWRVRRCESEGDCSPYSQASRFVTNTTALAAWWSFDEGQGGSSDDLSLYSNVATFYNGVSWDQDGVIGSAAHFDGSNDSIRVGYPTSGLYNNPMPWSIVFWFKWDEAVNTNPTVPIYLAKKYDGTDGWYFKYDPSTNTASYFNRYYAGLTNAALDSALLDKVVNLEDGQWHQIGAVCSPSYNGFIIDGVIVDADGSSFGNGYYPVTKNTETLYIGAADTTAGYDHSIDEFMMFQDGLALDFEERDMRDLFCSESIMKAANLEDWPACFTEPAR